MTPAQPSGRPARRDIVVIGGSAGSIEALRDLVAQLPPALAIAVFVVVHILPTSHSRLPLILERAGWLPARHAEDGDAVETGRILVAPPDRHLVLHSGGVEVNRGPRESSTRPAIDPLFRSAAAVFGPRVCGVVLSGNLDDGSEGLRLIAEAGGLAMVQDPEEAAHPEMPLNALRSVPSAEVLSAMRAGRRIAAVGRPPAVAGRRARSAPRPRPDVPAGARETAGAPTGLACPDCGGALLADPDGEHLRCPAGHDHSLEALSERRGASVEQALWASLRALRDGAGLAGRLEDRARQTGSQHMAARFAARRQSAERDAAILENLLFDREPP